MQLGNHTEVTFTNAEGEHFHMSVFSPSATGVQATPPEDDGPPVLLCVHGAGMSGDTFHRLAAYLQRAGKAAVPRPSPPAIPPAAPAHASASFPPPPPGRPPTSHAPAPARPGGPPQDCAFVPQPDSMDGPVSMAVVTFDLRCHGGSTFAGGEDHLTLEVMAKDFQDVLAYTKATLFPKSDFFVLGHSLGGPIVAHVLSTKESQQRVAGVVLVDVVEGTAKLSLRHMNDFLLKRPTSFDSIKDAEAWFLRHGGMRSPEGAAVSVPPLLREDPASGKLVWRSDLAKMEPVWDHWYDGLDKAFVALPFPKMLCLANAERLDTELTVAQMQGKFQFEIIGNECGHYIMDDATAMLGSKIMRFVKRIETLSKKLKAGLRPGVPLHLNNATIPPSRMGM